MRHGTPHARLIEDSGSFEVETPPGGHVYRPRWQLFLPTLAIAVLYCGFYLHLHLQGRADGALSRLVLIVLALGVPLLCAHAFLRFATIRVQVLPGSLRFHPGWPRDLPVDMPYALVDRVQVRKGLSGRIFGGGTLVIHLTTGSRSSIADLADPEKAAGDIATAMARQRMNIEPVS